MIRIADQTVVSIDQIAERSNQYHFPMGCKDGQLVLQTALSGPIIRVHSRNEWTPRFSRDPI
jgi:hypothetical protein